MPVRASSALLLLLLGLIGLRNSVSPTPSAAELKRPHGAPSSAGSIYQVSEKLCEVESADVCESSGLTRCASDSQLLWTHNDSGGKPAIVAFDRQGKIHGVVAITGATNRDWEEMTSFHHRGDPWLIIGDCGNNFLQDRPVRLYFIREPSPSAREAPCDYHVDIQFEHGARNCEAMAVDEHLKKILFVSKVPSGRCEVFEAPLAAILPASDRIRSELASTILVIAKRIAAPELAQVTGMCISADGQRLVIVNYQTGFEFCKAPNEPWQNAFARPPQRIDLSWRMPQRETVCFDSDDRSLLMTSESRQGFLNSLLGKGSNFRIPLWRVPAKPIGQGSRWTTWK
jgi:hypothetical protein